MDTFVNQQTVIPRVGLQHPYTQHNETRQEVFLPVSSVPQPEQLCRLPFDPRIHRQLYVPAQQVCPPNAAPFPVPSALFNQSTIGNQMPATTFSYPGFPSPQPGTFLIYLLRYCPQQTSVCFGCRASLKPGGAIANSPADLLIVSNMEREWMKDGQVYRKSSNVYFHCIRDCVLQKQPYFQTNQCIVPEKIAKLLDNEHWHLIRQSFGNLAIC